jgi:hypothetical protein
MTQEEKSTVQIVKSALGTTEMEYPHFAANVLLVLEILSRHEAALHWATRCLESDGNFGAVANCVELLRGNFPPERAWQ